MNQEADDEEDDFLADEMGPKEKILEAKSKVTHLVHCPYYPEVRDSSFCRVNRIGYHCCFQDKYEWWWVYLCDRKNRMLICPPMSVTTLITEEEVWYEVLKSLKQS